MRHRRDRIARFLALTALMFLWMPSAGCDADFIEDFFAASAGGLQSGVKTLLNAVVDGTVAGLAPNVSSEGESESGGDSGAASEKGWSGS